MHDNCSVQLAAGASYKSNLRRPYVLDPATRQRVSLKERGAIPAIAVSSY